MILGITGSIGSGKTTAAKIFSRYHYSRIDADEIGHSLMNNKRLKNKLIKNFGNEILSRNKNIDRKKLGNIVFTDKNKLKKLNLIMHPLIITEIKTKFKKIQKKYGGDSKIIIDAPLLLETNLKNYVDKVIVVKADKNKIIMRLNKKSPREKIERILKAQMPLNEKIKHADFVVDNSRNIKHLENQVKKIIEELNQKLC